MILTRGIIWWYCVRKALRVCHTFITLILIQCWVNNYETIESTIMILIIMILTCGIIWWYCVRKAPHVCHTFITLWRCSLQHIATHRNTLQHTETPCAYRVTHRRVRFHTSCSCSRRCQRSWARGRARLPEAFRVAAAWCVAVCCDVLQCVAVRCSVLPCVAVGCYVVRLSVVSG